MITKRPAPTESDYRESTPLSDIDETIIWETELDIQTLEDDSSGIYNKSKLSSKKCKRNINICGYNLSVFVTWKKNITDFSSRITTITNENDLDKPIQFLVKYKKHKYTYYIYIKYLASCFGLRTRELKEEKMKEILKIIY